MLFPSFSKRSGSKVLLSPMFHPHVPIKADLAVSHWLLIDLRVLNMRLELLSEEAGRLLEGDST